MLRVLILCEYPTLLGGERSMLVTLGHMAAEGFEITVAAPPSGALADALRANSIEHVPWQVRDDRGVRRPLTALRSDLAELIESIRPALTHANSLSTSRIAGPVAADAGMRSISHLRDIVRLNQQAVSDINRHALVVAVSDATRDYHIAQGIAPTKCIVVRNGVDLTLFRSQLRNGDLHRELDLAPTASLVITIGQLGLRKATDVVLAAAAQVIAQLDEVHWLIVGERTSEKAESREFEARLHAIASTPPLIGRVHFLGSRNNVPQLMAECELLVHAARQEPLGRVLLEAAACGLPVVATDSGGTREIFPSEADGAVLVPIDDATAIAQATIGILKDGGHRAALRLGARRRAVHAFDAKRAARELVAVYRQIL